MQVLCARDKDGDGQRGEGSLKEFYSCEEIAERYGVKLPTVWKWIRTKRLRAVKIGKQYRIPIDSVIELESKEG